MVTDVADVVEDVPVVNGGDGEGDDDDDAGGGEGADRVSPENGKISFKFCLDI